MFSVQLTRKTRTFRCVCDWSSYEKILDMRTCKRGLAGSCCALLSKVVALDTDKKELDRMRFVREVNIDLWIRPAWFLYLIAKSDRAAEDDATAH